MLKHLTLIGLITFAGLLADSAAALACEPPHSHLTEVIADDSPECLSLDGNPFYAAGTVSVLNECGEEVVLRVVECDLCDSQLVLAPGESANLTVEARGRAEFGESAITRQIYTWELGEAEGIFKTEVNYRDNSQACNSVFGCSQSGAFGSPAGGGAVVLLLVMVFGLRRRLGV